MSVKIKIRLILSIFIMSIVVSLLMLYMTNRNIYIANNQNDLTFSIIKKIFDLETINHDLLENFNKRAYIQWGRVYGEIGDYLDQASFPGDEQRTILYSLRENYRSIKYLTGYLRDKSNSEELNERLSGQILIKYQAIALDAERLSIYSSNNLKKALKNETKVELVSAFIFIGSIIIVYVIFAKQISDPLRELTESCTYINENYSGQIISPRILQSTDEIGQLANAFLRLINSLKESIQETDTLNEELEARVIERTNTLNDTLNKLASSEELFRRIYEFSSHGIALASLDGKFIRVNKALCDICGYEESELIGKSFAEITYVDDLEEELPLVERLKTGELNTLQIEKRYVHKNGQIVWILLSAVIVSDAKGEPLYFLGQMIDITDRKIAQEEIVKYADTQKILLSEVNHRVKNNLTAIISMMHMEEIKAHKQAKHDYEILLKEFTSRIESLFTVHTMLSNNEWKPLYISDLGEEIINSAVTGMSHRRDVDVSIINSQILISSNQAHQLTLVFNELATNTLKHSHLEEPLKIKMEAHMDNQEIVIIYSDNGIGYPQDVLDGKKERFSVGFDMLNGIVKKSLGGRISFYNDNGAICQISFREDISL